MEPPATVIPSTGHRSHRVAGPLVPVRTASVVAAVVEVDDAATASLMVTLHEHLPSGASLAVATASSFICLGAICLGAASPAALPTS